MCKIGIVFWIYVFQGKVDPFLLKTATPVVFNYSGNKNKLNKKEHGLKTAITPTTLSKYLVTGSPGKPHEVSVLRDSGSMTYQVINSTSIVLFVCGIVV